MYSITLKGLSITEHDFFLLIQADHPFLNQKLISFCFCKNALNRFQRPGLGYPHLKLPKNCRKLPGTLEWSKLRLHFMQISFDNNAQYALNKMQNWPNQQQKVFFIHFYIPQQKKVADKVAKMAWLLAPWLQLPASGSRFQGIFTRSSSGSL